MQVGTALVAGFPLHVLRKPAQVAFVEILYESGSADAVVLVRVDDQLGGTA